MGKATRRQLSIIAFVGASLGAVAALSGCAAGTDGDDARALAALVCLDADHDGFGAGCPAGTDCDDTSAQITNECRGCADPDTNCGCDSANDVPVPCYVYPPVMEEMLVCHQGVRYCRDNRWTSCLEIHSYAYDGDGASEPGAAREMLIDGPQACNACDPLCGIAHDYPNAADLTASNSSSVRYDTSAGGVTLTSSGSTGSTTWSVDTDGDGIPDVADSYPTDRTRTGVEGGFYQSLPYGGAAVLAPLVINTQVRTADVYFLMDTTGSMGGELANLQATLTTGTLTPGCPGGVIGAIRCAIPDAWFGVGHVDDYPVSPFGSEGLDVVYGNHLDITSDVTATQSAVNSLVIHSGWDWPEAQSQALWAVASGAPGGLGPYLAPRTGCAAGRWGYPCFRNGTIPIVIMFTDAPYHNGPTSAYDYTTLAPAAPVPTAVSTSNETVATAYNVGDITTRWVAFSGTTNGMNNDYTGFCGATSARDAVFRFSLTAPTTVTVSLEGSGYDTILAIASSAGAIITCNDDAVGTASRVTVALAAGTYYAYVDGRGNAKGTYQITMGVPPTAFTPRSWTESINALNARGVKTIVVESSDGYDTARTDADALCNATSSVGAAGAPFRFSIPSTGTGLGATVVSAVQTLANYSRSDVTAVARDNTTTGAIDERGFVASITAASFPAGRCTAITGGTTFSQCLPGTNLNFQVSFRNNFVMPTTVAQVFNFTIDVLANNTYVLGTYPVRIVVPPSAPAFPPSGTYTRAYDATTRCIRTERPNWHGFSWTASTPGTTRIRFDFRTGSTAARAASATPVGFDVPGTTSPRDIGALLVAGAQWNNLPYLDVTATLYSSTDRATAPVLTGFELTFDCVASE